MKPEETKEYLKLCPCINCLTFCMCKSILTSNKSGDIFYLKSNYINIRWEFITLVCKCDLLKNYIVDSENDKMLQKDFWKQRSNLVKGIFKIYGV